MRPKNLELRLMANLTRKGLTCDWNQIDTLACRGNLMSLKTSSSKSGIIISARSLDMTVSFRGQISVVRILRLEDASGEQLILLCIGDQPFLCYVRS